jgi:hypothetical protein
MAIASGILQPSEDRAQAGEEIGGDVARNRRNRSFAPNPRYVPTRTAALGKKIAKIIWASWKYERNFQPAAPSDVARVAERAGLPLEPRQSV